MQIEVFVPDLQAAVLEPFAIVAEGVERGTRYLNEQALGQIYVKAKKNFEESIKRPNFSATLGGTVYRPGSRATGSFTFGPGGAFEGRVITSGPVQEVEFPNIDQADAATQGAWRALEFGTDSVSMPIGYWRSVGGERVPGGAGSDDQLVQGGRGMIEVGGIEAKQFIGFAVSEVADKLEQAYLDLADEVVQEAVSFAAPVSLGQPPSPGPGYTVWVSSQTPIKSGPAAGYYGYWRRPPGGAL